MAQRLVGTADRLQKSKEHSQRVLHGMDQHRNGDTISLQELKDSYKQPRASKRKVREEEPVRVIAG